VSVNNPAIQPLGESKSHGEMMRLIAARMGLDSPALRESDEEIAGSSLPDAISLEALKADGWKKTFPAQPELEAGTLRLTGITTGDVPNQDNRLQLLTPKAHYFLNSSYVNLARQRRGMDRPTLEIDATDAESRGLGDGDRVTIRNAQGELTAWLRVGTSVRPGVVSLTGKWWSHPWKRARWRTFSRRPRGRRAASRPTTTFVDVVAAPLPVIPDQAAKDRADQGDQGSIQSP
jgi:anaerobic selenocysteine-containing dehydrogenase